MSGRPHVAVVGGGLAGLAAAIACGDGGADVTLLEARARLGGLTWSFERDGLTFDNGQHVYLRCCTTYRRFLDRIGSTGSAPLQERLALPVVRPGGSTGWLRTDRLPAPLHLARSLLSYPHMSLRERMRIGPAALALRRLDLADPALDTQSFGQWPAKRGQSDGAVEALWDLITLPTVNLRCGEASLALAAKVFQTGLLTETGAADIGWARVPLQELHGDAATTALTRQGASVRTRARATSLSVSAEGVVGVKTGGKTIDADAVILAVPPDVAGALLPQGAVSARHRICELGSSPIVNVHVVYDRRVTDLELAAGIGTPAQFVFDRTDASGLASRDTRDGVPRRGQCLAVSLSAADGHLATRSADLVRLVTDSLASLFPAARHASVRDAVVTRERFATFRGAPGSAGNRPGSATSLADLFLAGAWTDTGWPATMEGAVRSGAAAAALALSAAGAPGRRDLYQLTRKISADQPVKAASSAQPEEVVA